MEKVLVLMSTYNGESYLDEQLNSIFNQEGVDVDLYIRDDGSTDKTLDIIRNWQKKGNINFYQGENLRPAKSFMNLISNSGGYKYYALSDQDDFWKKNKLITALSAIKEKNNTEPTLYYSMSTITDEKLQKLDKSDIEKKYTFAESLVRNNAQGATMVFNDSMIELIKSHIPLQLDMHDSWIYSVAKGVGANIIYDYDSYMYYRQHNNNVIGKGEKDVGLFKKIKRKLTLTHENKGLRYENVIEMYKGYYNFMSPQDKKVLLKVLNYKKNIITKIMVVTDTDINTGSILRKISFAYDIFFELF